MLRTRIVLLALLVSGATFAAAKPPFLKVFLDNYKIKPDSTLGKARCMICHAQPGPPNLNPYGKAVKGGLDAAKARMVTPEILKSIEKKDSGDKVPFIEKIKKDQLPGGSPAKQAALVIALVAGCAGACFTGRRKQS